MGQMTAPHYINCAIVLGILAILFTAAPKITANPETVPVIGIIVLIAGAVALVFGRLDARNG